MADLFASTSAALQPLASRMRPQTLAEFVGQSQLVGPDAVLTKLIAAGEIPSMIFWGPPGVGKTTLARLIARQAKAAFVNFSAVTSGIKEIRTVMEEAEQNRQLGQATIVFIDEIHRFNKAQQDAFLPYVERGSITLIGATTENPSFEVNAALLSRARVFVLQPLAVADLTTLLQRALTDPRGYGLQQVTADADLLTAIATFANGDARVALNTLELAVTNAKPQDGRTVVTQQDVAQLLTKKALLYDKNGEEHYNLISALHKSMRNSDVDAAIYWLSRMLEGGEDPLYVARRLVRFASEDVGMADSRALEIATSVFQACQFIGMPECAVHLTHAVVYLSLAPKSNALYTAYEAAKKDAQATVAEPVPLQIRNGVTPLMKDLGYGKDYEYAHDTADKLTAMQTMPDNLVNHHYYHPTTLGSEAKVKARLDQIQAWHQAHPTDKD
ncbi:replication-associated recombination protein A [Lacticaseibacillus daqingensis]|uniref:replication-associated recombination protein A n=1 Tax=Lacticaseibacillus daqingensis TaxID=2486014 RepID=UPI000F7AC088|nr:replication-associated recombination protein A [Lacticaseibacillus daqingensis]